MEPLKPFEARLTPHYWALPLALAYYRGRVSVQLLCLSIEFGAT